MYQMCPYSFCDRDTITFMFIRRNEDLNTQQRSSEESRRLATSLKLSQIEPFVKIEVVVVNLLEKIFTEFIFLSFSSTSYYLGDLFHGTLFVGQLELPFCDEAVSE